MPALRYRPSLPPVVTLGISAVAALLAAVPPAAAAQPDGFWPAQYRENRQDPYGYGRRNEEPDRGRRGGDGVAGTYQRSCGDVRQRGSTLYATCDNGRGRRVETSIDLDRCGRSDISNNGGVLQCGNYRGGR